MIWNEEVEWTVKGGNDLGLCWLIGDGDMVTVWVMVDGCCLRLQVLVNCRGGMVVGWVLF